MEVWHPERFRRFRGISRHVLVNSKLLSGSLLASAGLLAAVANAWAGHLFFALFHVARAESLESVGSFDPGQYGGSPGATAVFVGLRVLIWVVLLGGLGLVGWGVYEEWTGREAGE